MNKSIHIMFIGYILLVILTIFISHFLTTIPLKFIQYAFVTELLIPFIIPIFIFHKKPVLIIASITIAVWLILLINFRSFRSLVFGPEIGKEKIVGYTHYFGYPFYFDTILFFVFIFVPLCVAAATIYIQKKVKR